MRRLAPSDVGTCRGCIWLHERQRSVWAVYEADGRRLLVHETPRPYQPWAVAPNGDILASYRDPATDEHRIVRLRIRLEASR